MQVWTSPGVVLGTNSLAVPQARDISQLRDVYNTPPQGRHHPKTWVPQTGRYPLSLLPRNRAMVPNCFDIWATEPAPTNMERSSPGCCITLPVHYTSHNNSISLSRWWQWSFRIQIPVSLYQEQYYLNWRTWYQFFSNHPIKDFCDSFRSRAWLLPSSLYLNGSHSQSRRCIWNSPSGRCFAFWPFTWQGKARRDGFDLVWDSNPR